MVKLAGLCRFRFGQEVLLLLWLKAFTIKVDLKPFIYSKSVAPKVLGCFSCPYVVKLVVACILGRNYSAGGFNNRCLHLMSDVLNHLH